VSRLIGLLLCSVLFLQSCAHNKASNKKKVKNVIFVIGDGMGPQQLSLLQLFANSSKYSPYKNGKTHLQKMMDGGETGIVYTQPEKFLVTDSSCSATQYATGKYSLPEVVGVDDSGKKVKTILEAAKEKGLSTGLVSDTRLTHATPASYAAHNKSRQNENAIAEEMLKTGADVMLSGGLRHFIPKGLDKDLYWVKRAGKKLLKKSKRKDNKNLLVNAEKLGYQLVFNKKQMNKVESGKVLGLFTNSGMADGIIHNRNVNNKNNTEPTLSEMTEVALNQLSKNDKGFFLMVEAGQIDWAGHRNDAGTLLHEMLKMDQLLGTLLEFAKKNEDTLIVVTADHETGSFGMSYSGYKNTIETHKVEGVFSEKVYKSKYNYGSHKVLDKLYEQKQSYMTMLKNFSKTSKSPKDLQKIINDNSSFKLNLDEAKEILKNKKNKNFIKGHKYHGHKHLPNINEYPSFYPYGEMDRSSLIARILGKYQNIVWGTATHTSTPVTVVAYGPEGAASLYDGAHHSTEIGQITFEVLGLD